MARRKARTTRASVGMELIDGDVFLKQLEKLTAKVQNDVVHDAVEAGTRPILAAMIPNTPESSGSRDKQSKTTKQRWSGSKKLKNTIRAVVRKRTRFGVVSGAIGLVGPDYKSGGGHGNLFASDHKRRVYWGRDAGGTRQVNQFVKKTADQSRSAASSALRAALAKGIDQAARATAK
jgi:HK97 gp10 family phage protein